MAPQFENIVIKFIDEAYNANRNSKSCHMALLLKGRKKVISYGFNRMERQLFRGKTVNSLHAEIDCIRKIKQDISNYTLIIVKISKTDELRYYDSMPCKHCTDFIINAGLKRVYCSNNSGKIVKINLNDYVPYNIN